MTRRNEVERVRANALSSAGLLAGYLRAGGELQPLPCSIRLDAGEVCYGEGAAVLSQYFPWDLADPEAVQWRHLGVVPVIATSHRVMACQHGRWLSWWYSGVRQLVPDPGGLSVALLLDRDRPTRFEGSFVPWLSVLLTRLLYGEILDPGPAPLGR